MKSAKATISSEEGMHARPAGELVKIVKEMAPTKVTVGTGSRTVNAASILSLMSLGLKQGTEVTITVEGGDEEVCLNVLTDFINNFK